MSAHGFAITTRKAGAGWIWWRPWVLAILGSRIRWEASGWSSQVRLVWLGLDLVIEWNPTPAKTRIGRHIRFPRPKAPGPRQENG